MDEDLKECPFCGPLGIEGRFPDISETAVGCERCGAMHADAEIWNRRYDDPAALLKAREEGIAEAMESEAVKGMRETLKEIGDYGHEDGLYCPRVANEAGAVFDAYKKSLSENQTKGRAV